MIHEKLKIWYLYLTVFITGAAVLVIEILGTRVLAPFYGSTIYVWSSLITVTLGALALGYYLGGRLIDKFPDHRLFFGSIFLSGFSLVLISFFTEQILILTEIFGLRFGPLAAAAALYSFPLIFLGGVSPMAVKLYARNIAGIGVAAGSLYALATVGSLFGGVLSGFFLVPNFSVKVIGFLVSLTLFFLSFFGLLVFGGVKFYANFSFAALSVATIYVFAITYSGVKILYPDKRISLQAISGGQNEQLNYSPDKKGPEDMPRHPIIGTTKGELEEKILYSEPSIYGQVVVGDHLNRNRDLFVDGSIITTYNFRDKTSTTHVREMADLIRANIPDGGDILLIGLGGGGFLKDLAGTDYKIDAVEINPNIVFVAEKFFGLPDSVSYNIHIDDGLHFIRQTIKKYDVIVLDLCNILEENAHLYTKEFYKLAGSRLKDDGILIQSLYVYRAGSETRLDHMVANGIKESLDSVYTTERVPMQKDNWEIINLIGASSERELAGTSMWDIMQWPQNSKYGVITNDNALKAVRYHLPVVNEERKQLIGDFGTGIRLPL